MLYHLVASLLSLPFSYAAICDGALKPQYNVPVAADGWSYQLVANGFKRPRSIVFDPNDAMLVLDARAGIEHITFKDNGGTCLTVDKKTTLVASSEV
jgi:glucose/arabinose dehydrogenase